MAEAGARPSPGRPLAVWAGALRPLRRDRRGAPGAERHTPSPTSSTRPSGVELQSRSLFVESRHFVICHAEASQSTRGYASLLMRISRPGPSSPSWPST